MGLKTLLSRSPGCYPKRMYPGDFFLKGLNLFDYKTEFKQQNRTIKKKSPSITRMLFSRSSYCPIRQSET